MSSGDSRSFLATLVGDGRPVVIFSAIVLALAGAGAIFLSVTGHFLPHDVEFLGMEPVALCELNQCRIVHFMIHDRMSFGGVLLSIAVLYLWLAMFPLKEGESWAWWIIALTNATGFGSFLAYIGYGYLDSWHATATAGLLPFSVFGLWKTRELRRRPPTRACGSLPSSWRSRTGYGWLCWMAWGLGMTAAGATILVVGMTLVFVPSDLTFIGYTREQLDAINPRLIPLIAHDRAGFGGGLFSTGLLVLAIVWKARPSRHLWQALVIAGVAGFGCAISVHYPIGYLDFWHLAPAWAGGAIFIAGACFSWRQWEVNPHPDSAPRKNASRPPQALASTTSKKRD
jgi:hypothetical protein